MVFHRPLVLVNSNWGRIQFEPRTSPRDYNSYNDNGYTGISTAGLIQRSKPLKFVNYI